MLCAMVSMSQLVIVNHSYPATFCLMIKNSPAIEVQHDTFSSCKKCCILKLHVDFIIMQQTNASHKTWEGC
jgi:hypothetical protein